MNKQAELTRWTPKRLLSLLMALIMTLSLLPTAAFAFGDGETNTKDASTVALAPTRNHVADGTIEGTNTKFSLLFSIDRKEVSKPGERVNVTAYAELKEGSDDDVKMTKVSLTDNKTDYGEKSWSHTEDDSILGNPKVGEDGSADFTISVEYEINGTTTGSKSVRVVIKNLWTGYNITFTAPEGLTGVKFTGGIPEDGKAKTSFRDEEKGDFTPVYTIPASADAILDGYTFEGWTFRNLKTADGSVIGGTVAAGANYTYDFGSDATFTAELYKNQQITFDAGDYGGVTGILNKVQYSRGTKYDITVQDPKLDGYQFTGWLQEGTSYIYHKGGTVAGITSATKLIAQWTPDDGSAPVGSHKVTFLAGAADAYIPFVATATVKDGTDYTIPTNKPTREGYEFKGWNDGTNTYQAGATISGVTKDIVLSAMWQQEMVTVTFPAADHLPAGVSYVATPASTPVAKGSNVTFRLKLAEGYDPATLHVFADGVALLGTPVNSYDVYYEYTVHNVMADTIIHVGPVTEKTFNVTLPTGAGFDAAFVVPAGTVPAGAADNKLTTVNYDGTVSFTVKARPGYTVEGVYANGVKLDPDTSTTDTYTIKNIKSNQAVMVDMAAVQFHTVTYVLDGTQMAAQSVANGSKATSLPAPDKTGYTWYNNKWYTDKDYTTEFDFNTLITKDTILYGRYAPIDVTISYDVLPGVTTTKTYGLAATLTETIPTKDGCTFLGWSESDGATAASYLPGATFSKEIDHNITLYAVWQKQTFNISLSSGTGYSIHHTQPLQVEYGDTFSFRVAMSKGYSQTAPSVWMNWVDAAGTEHSHQLTNPTETTDGTSGLAVYHYTTPEIYWNATINVVSAADLVYTVTYKYAGLDGRTEYPKNDDTYLTQNVSWNEAAAQPAAPSVDGYKFVGWYKDAGLTTPWDFATEKVIGPTTIYAKLDPIYPEITWKTPTATDGYTIAVEYTAPGSTTGATALTTPGPVDYGSTVTFTIKILDGYDASQMQVGINNQLLAPKDKSPDGKTYTFEFTAKENTKITVVGVARKTVTIIYNANARDDVSGMPEAQTVKYYLDTAVNDTIIKQFPVRTGYDFLGWNKDSKAGAADSDYTVDKIKAGTTAKFTENTTLYAVWKAVDTTVSLKVTDVAATDTTTPTAPRYLQYEGEKITLQATLSVGAKGTIEFYKAATSGTAGTKIGSTTVNGETAELTVKVGEYKTTAKDEYYYAIFKSEADEGYAGSTSAVEHVGILSKAIRWSTDTDASELLVYKGNSATGTSITDPMIAGQTYTLKVKTDKITGVETLDSKQPVLGKDYKIVWQYTEVGKNDWKTDGEASDKATYLVTGDKSGYQFRAQIVPLGNDHDSLYLKAAKYNDAGLVIDQYDVCLYTKSTNTTVKQKTTTELAITGADDEAAAVTIAGTTPFATIGDHKAQFEGQKVTLTATVTDDSTSKGVTTGFVNFYRKGATDTLNASPIAVGTNGVATCEVEISKWTGGNVTENKDEFYAVYLANATYNTSASWTATTGKLEAVYIKSTAIQTPIIDSTLPGKLNGVDANSTSYDYDLTGLLAGVQHTFKLRVGNDKADWSVVALDGRTVEAKNYTIQWITKSGDNAETTAATGSEFKTSDNKVDDEIYVRLNPTGDMKTGADSKKAIIGTKQGVKVTVEAIDAIDKTPTAKDVYQLNEIELRATVTAADAKASMQPDGLVQFYYVDDNNFVEIGKPVSIQTVDGARYASIKTNQLPVTAVDNTKRDVKITAVYLGDTTFKASDNWQLKSGSTTEWEVTAADITDTVKSDTVTVYSSVVYAGEKENQAAQQSNYGISITANGALKANESSVTLTLDQVYTLDHPIDLSKLTYNTDYTVQWQILKNALQHQDSSAGSYATTDKWEDLSGQTGTSYTDTMEQDAAYRAKITVKDTPIAKGSFTEVTQTNPGRKVYYSNVLVVGAGMATVTTNITTSANQNFNEEGIVSGETATIHVLASGAAKTTPISTVTATITKSGAPEPVFNEKANNVNGYTSFAWDTSDLTPGYYTLTVTAESNNGYAPQTITRTLIVRDNAYTLKATKESKVYNGKAQGIDWELTGVDIENALAQKSVVVYYYDKDGKMVEPTQAGKYQYDLYLPASAYWTELTHITGTFIIEKRKVSVDDLVAQAKVYDGTPNANIQEIILHDATVDPATGLPNEDIGIIDGDSVYAVGTGYTDKAAAGTAKLGVKDVILEGDDAANYEFKESDYTEVFNIQRSQVKGAIVSGRTYKYTGKDIKLAASDIYLIDQAGNQLTDYDVTYYYHNGDGVEKVDAMNKMGKYTVIARPEQTNYKGGATAIVYVGNTDTPGTLDNSAKSSLITISNTVELYGAAENKGIVATATKGTATAYYYYNNGTSTDWHTDVPANAGRYLVKATVTNDGVTDTAYGIYTVVKARPALTLTATNATYNSAQYNGAPTGNYNDGALPADTYYTYTGGTIQGVAYEAPTEAGDYVVTAHVGKAANYTAHEISANFTIDKAPLTIKADDLQRWQYGSFPDMVASYQGLATDGVAEDTSLRDVQIQPEFLFNEQKGGYTNHAFDQAGTYPVTVRNALARNYTVTYKDGKIATTAEEPKAELAIHGMPDNGTTTENLVYYGDTIQLYAYGYYKTLDSNTSSGSYNTSSLIEWSVSDASIAKIDQSGLLTIKGVGTFTVTLTRGSGSAAISTTINVVANPKEVSIDVPDVDKVYTASAQTYDGTLTVNGLINSDSVTPTVTTGTDKRTVVGSQITSYTVNDTKYVSETYGGLFTINVKNVSVTPNEISVIYGEALGTPGTLGTLGYTESNTVGGVAALTDGKAVSERDAYINLDVLNGYEILVAGKENENYNVKYVTDQDAPDVEVTAKALTISTGTLKDQIGMTSGSLNPMGKYPVNGDAVNSAIAMGMSNVRMYGEPNWVMDETLDTLISGDTLADLTALGNKLVSFNYNIGADANVEYNARTTFLSGKNKYDVETNDSMMAFKNYDETYTLGTQNIYQRPVTLSVPSGMTLTAYKPSILDSSNQVKNDVLLNLLLNNLIVSKYNNEGGLAELLKHTIKDLNIQINSTQVTGDKLTVKIALGNQNYWLDSASSTIEIELVSTKIVPVYSPLDWTSFTVTMYNETKTTPVAISGNVRFFIFQKKDGVELKYSNYKNDTIIRSGLMDPTGRTGEFRATFSRLPAGDYAIFAIAENYTIVE